MSVSNDPRNFFQSDQSIEKAERRARKQKELKDKGNPISVPTKILALLPDTSSPNHVYIAEAGNVARRLNIQDPKEPQRVYRGHSAPVTSLALNRDASILYTGSWDKSILAFSATEKKVLKTFIGHADFVKALLYVDLIPSKPMLISGSSDSSIIIWNPETGAKLHTLKSHGRGVQALAIDPVESTRESVVLYSAGSKQEIKKWIITTDKVTEECEIVEHETGVNSIRFLGEEGEEDLWTASSDMTAKRFERAALTALGREKKGIDPDTELWHADFVNDVAMDVTGRWVITACSDEEVRVWDAASSKLYHTYSGHYDVVTAIAVVGTDLISVSLDATVRKWSLKPAELKVAVEEAQKGELGEVAEDGVGSRSRSNSVLSNNILTEEEERELAELMAEEDN
ncbi:Beta-TrCP [Dactylella cylindrospora]|nr:Beta-TrCP [Dactylella cylindrospora]